MAVTIYHNPRCSKSRQTLQLLADSGVAHTVVLYLDETPDAKVIVDDESGKAVIGRPPENVLQLVS